MFFKKKRRNIFESRRYRLDHQVRFRNPLGIKKGIFRFKIFKIINLLLFVGILFCLYFFIFSSFYNITNIEVSGNQIISTADVLDITNDYLAKNHFFILKNKNIFLFNRNEFKREISKVVVLDEIKIEKILPNTLRLTFKEKDAALEWLTNDQKYLVDRNGLIIKQFYKAIAPKIFQLVEETNPKENEIDNFLKINNLANQPVNLGDKVLNKENIEFIFNLIKELDSRDYLKIKDIFVPNNFPQSVNIGLARGGQIYFNLGDLLADQLNRLDILVKEKIKKENLVRLDYIDLRLGESIYYKFK